MNLFRPYKTLAVGAVLGVVLWPIIRGRLGSPGA